MNVKAQQLGLKGTVYTNCTGIHDPKMITTAADTAAVMRACCEIPGLSAVKPKAAFYIFPKLDVERFNIHDDEQFALDLLHAKQVLIVPGKGFNYRHPDHFRIVYLPDVRKLKNAMERIADFLDGYRQK